MGWLRRLHARVFAAVYDRAMAAVEKAGLAERRRDLLAGAGGRILEIGAGTGVNLAFHPRAGVEVVLTEPDAFMARRLEWKLAASGRAEPVVRAEAESLPFEDGSFDVVLSTLVLCTVKDPARAMAEIHRVLRPGGRLLLLEHVRSGDPRRARWQDRLDWLQSRVACGCHCNRDTVGALRAAGFDADDLVREDFPALPPHARSIVRGAATRA